jgi:hypothetical protein
VKNLFVIIALFLSVNLFSQEKDSVAVIQFSGRVVTADENGDIMPLPYVNVGIMNSTRGDFSDYDGFFSFVGLAGERVVFSRIGYKTVEYVIPDSLTEARYTYIQIMSQDNVLLPEVVIMPWPSREHFKQEFLALDVTSEVRDAALANLAENVMRELRYTIPADGRETSDLVFQQQQIEYQYSGQIKPQRIFDPLAWKRFIDAWRRGDFKNKKEKK